MASDTLLIFGGSFDPVHNAHIALVRHFIACFETDSILVLPCGQPYQKSQFISSATDRLAMLHLAFDNLPVTIDERELKNDAPTYTVNTLRDLRLEYGYDRPFVFIMGADQFINLHTWYQWTTLFELTHLAVSTRPGFDLSHLNKVLTREVKRRQVSSKELIKGACGHVWLDDTIHLDVSASQIRQMIQNNQAIDKIPDTVLNYINTHNLYR